MLTAYDTDSLENPFVKEAFSLNDFWDMSFLSVTDYFITEKRLCQEFVFYSVHLLGVPGTL